MNRPTDSPLRVALVILRADPARGGAERYTLQLASSLLDRDARPTLITAETPTTSAASDDSSAVDRVTLPAAGLTRSARYRHFCRLLADHLHDRPYDLVHAMLPLPPGLAHIYHPHAGIAAQPGGSRLGWLTNPRRRLFARTEADMLASPPVPLVLTLSGYVEQTLRRHHPHLPPDRTARLFNAVDLARFDPAAVQPADDAWPGGERPEPLCLFVGHDFARKGLAEAIRAVAQVPQAGLLVVGRDVAGPYRRLAESLSAGERVRFIEPRGDVRGLYAAADVLLLPTRHDPCALVVIEALAMGLPVVSTRQNGATEVMTAGEHGWVLDGPDDLAGAVRALVELRDPGRREKLRRACLELRPRLNWEEHVNRLLEIYAAEAQWHASPSAITTRAGTAQAGRV